jgi:transposase
MPFHAALDVSLETTSICVVDGEGTIVREGEVATDPDAIIAFLEGGGESFVRCGIEAGPLSPWLHGELTRYGLMVVCLETRHAKAALGAMRNKTDRNDARGLAQLVRTGWFRAVHVKSTESHELRMLLTSRKLLHGKCLDVENQIRGLLKTFGLRVGPVARARYDARIRELLAGRLRLLAVVEPLLRARAALLKEFNTLHLLLLRTARKDAVCRRLMTVPGVGPVSAMTFKTGVDDPTRFSRSRTVGAHFGLTPRQYSSGEIDRSGAISKVGDPMVRESLYEAAHIMLTRVRADLAVKRWAERLVRQGGAQKAKVALARKLAVILHRIWSDGSVFDPQVAA